MPCTIHPKSAITISKLLTKKLLRKGNHGQVLCFANAVMTKEMGNDRNENIASFHNFSSSSRNSSSSNSNGDTFSNYLYPLRTEAPHITRTTSKEAQNIAKIDASSSKKRRFLDGIDHFDDDGLLSAEELEKCRREQENDKQNSTALKDSLCITPVIPKRVPPNVPSQELIVPETQITTLDNGIRVVSKETYGQVTTIGIVADIGSRHEDPSQNETGMCHLLEILAFNSTTKHYESPLVINQLLQDWGGTRFVNYGREQSIFCIDILRPNVTKAMELLSSVFLYPKFLPNDILEAIRTIEFQSQDIPPELLLEQALQSGAYNGNSQQLGKEHFCPLNKLPYYYSLIESQNQHESVEQFHEFWKRHIINNPNGLVIAGAGIAHDELVSLANQKFGSLQQNQWSAPSSKVEQLLSSKTNHTIPSIYHGGEHIIGKKKTIDGNVRVSLAFELEHGWHSEELVPTCVLQTLLGGGNSFSAGGPGKGMYSRLYRNVLNRYNWVESAEAFTSIHRESGLWGMSGSCKPEKVTELYSIFAEQVARLKLLGDCDITDEELDRARNMLKCNVLTQLESRLILFEDLGRQVLTYGYREEMDTTCRKIEAVTKEEIQSLITKALSKPPTVAAVGENMDYVPSQKEVSRWFGQL